MSSAVHELKQIPFAHLIGSPLKAAIEAQALAAQTTIEFIHKVGFKQPLQGAADLVFANTEQDAEAGQLRQVTFEYTKTDETGNDNEFKLTVPLLSITPIPYIRIDEMTIDFKAKLTDSIQRKTDSSFQIDASVNASYSAFWSPVKVDVRVSSTYKTATSTQESSNREYSMDIHVRAVQDAMPAGLSKILDVLEDAITNRKKK